MSNYIAMKPFPAWANERLWPGCLLLCSRSRQTVELLTSWSTSCMGASATIFGADWCFFNAKQFVWLFPCWVMRNNIANYWWWCFLFDETGGQILPSPLSFRFFATLDAANLHTIERTRLRFILDALMVANISRHKQIVSLHDIVTRLQTYNCLEWAHDYTYI